MSAHSHMLPRTKHNLVPREKADDILHVWSLRCIMKETLWGWWSDKSHIECLWFMPICRHTHTHAPRHHTTRGVQGPHSILWIPEELKGEQRSVGPSEEKKCKQQPTSWCGQKSKDSQRKYCCLTCLSHCKQHLVNLVWSRANREIFIVQDSKETD